MVTIRHLAYTNIIASHTDIPTEMSRYFSRSFSNVDICGNVGLQEF
jgi:hypothetical protein